MNIRLVNGSFTLFIFSAFRTEESILVLVNFCFNEAVERPLFLIIGVTVIIVVIVYFYLSNEGSQQRLVFADFYFSNEGSQQMLVFADKRFNMLVCAFRVDKVCSCNYLPLWTSLLKLNNIDFRSRMNI